MSIRLQSQVKAAPDLSFMAVRSGLLQRRCACGGTSGPDGECAACRAKRLGLQRNATNTAALPTVPPIVHEVLRSPGQPLDVATRAFMEPRFGHDFGQVRVHTDTPAAKSARAVDALAFTVGRNVAFASGQYSPTTATGRRLLAHELAHVVQQRHRAQHLQAPLVVGEPHGRAEHEAERVAAQVTSGSHASAITIESRSQVLQKVGDPRSSPTPPPPAPQPAPTSPQPSSGFVCGPDVTTQLSDAVTHTNSTFASWPAAQKTDACHALTSLTTGAYAWDIGELHNNAWILSYRPACASQGADPHCGSAVKIGADCHYAGSANYAIFGVMCKLCNTHFTAVGSSDAGDFTESATLEWVNKYKGTGFTGLATPSANFVPSQNWARAGYRGWPASPAPAGDRSNCSPSCPTAYTGGAFTIHWVPIGWF